MRSIPPFLGVFKSDARFGTGTSFAFAMSIFFKLGHLPKTIHHFAVEKASKQLITKYQPQQSLSNSSRSVVKIDPLKKKAARKLFKRSHKAIGKKLIKNLFRVTTVGRA